MKVIIIGAGITGLSAAYYLVKKGHDVSVFDASREVGGLSGFFPIEGAFLEKYYHHIFIGHSDLIDLIKELGLEKHLYFQSAKMGFYHGGHVYPFANARDLIRFSPLKIRDRIRLGISSLRMMRMDDWREMEQESAIEWLRTYSGKEACRVIWEPLLKMKFGDEYDRISAAWLWNRVVDRKKSKGKNKGKDVLGYISGGYKILFDALVESITHGGGEIHTGTEAEEILIKEGVVKGVKTSSGVLKGDAVLSTVSIPAFINMVDNQLPAEYMEKLSSINYQHSICSVLILKRSLSKYYWINVSDPASPFVGIIEHTRLSPPENYRDHHIVYLTRYTDSHDKIMDKSDEEIYDLFINKLKSIFPGLKDKDILKYRIFKDRYSQPIFVKNYSQIMPDTFSPVKKLYILNTSQLYPESRCLNSSIVKARTLVEKIALDNGQ